MPDKQPETFAELVESWKLQPYQERILGGIFGMKVDIIPDPVDEKVGYIFNRDAVQGEMLFISTPGPDSLYDLLMESHEPPLYRQRPLDWWKAVDLFEATKYMLILDDGPTVVPPWSSRWRQRLFDFLP